MSARRKRVISTEEIQFNHKPAKMLLTEKRREVSHNGQTPSIIGICSYCVLDRPVFERCQTLLHPELTPWWSFLLADGAHHKKPHSPTHRQGEGEMRIFVLRWNLNGTQKGVTQESWGLNAGDSGPGWRWDANLCTLMEVRWYTDKVYTSILGFGFLWDRTWMEVRCTFLKPGWFEMMPGLGLNTFWGDWDGGDLSSGRRWGANMWTWIEVSLDMEEEKRESWSPNGVGMLIMRPGWEWDGTRI